MLVFIDDSGDPGFKIDKGSTTHFVISLIVFEDTLEAERAALAIKELKRKIGFPDSFEFKFNKARKKIRKDFLTTVNPFEFTIRCLVLEKERIYSEELRSNKNSFYSYAIKTALKHAPAIQEASVKIDGSGDRTFRKSFTTYLRKQLNSREKKKITTCKLVDSRSNVLIQMADMIAGSVRRFYDTSKADRKEYKQIIAKHIKDEWLFR